MPIANAIIDIADLIAYMCAGWATFFYLRHRNQDVIRRFNQGWLILKLNGEIVHYEKELLLAAALWPLTVPGYLVTRFVLSEEPRLTYDPKPGETPIQVQPQWTNLTPWRATPAQRG